MLDNSSGPRLDMDDTPPSPFSRFPEELLVLILEDLHKSIHTTEDVRNQINPHLYGYHR